MHFQISDPTAYHVALYIRLSKEDENTGPSASVQNQESLLREFARQQGLDIYHTYIDDGYSGTHFDRPAFRRMIADIESGKVNMVITKDLSRLGRDYILTGHYMERYFPEHRVRYISLLDGIDTGVESTANDITPFRAIMNDMYAKDISKKIKSVKRDKQQKGLFIGPKPVYGYKMHPTLKNKIVIDEEAAVIVRRIFALAVSGMSCRKIASTLNEDKVPSPATYCGWEVGTHKGYKGLWSSERISQMLKNETYIGNMVQGRRIKTSYKSKKCLRQAPENWIIVENTHEPLIERETFLTVQSLIRSRSHTRCRTYDFLLKGLIFCHECGHPLAVVNRKNAAGEDRLFFVCRTYQRFTKSSTCSSHCVKEETVNKAVLDKVLEICRTFLCPQFFMPTATQMVEDFFHSYDIENDLSSLHSRIDRINNRLDQLYLDRVSGLLAESDFLRLYDNMKNERCTLEKKLATCSQQKKQLVNTEQKAQTLVWQFLDSVLTNREVLTALIQRVELTKDKNIIIHFRFHEPQSLL
uniref:Recombinase domain-containing protein n=1 Tax=uncultured prokaryote TaxID=198431 RepID=A0A0H5Q533_9ZZZZ|nr:hypothetical protein [uncultured prokaryote]